MMTQISRSLKELRTPALCGSLIGMTIMWIAIGHFPVGSFFMVVFMGGIWLGSRLSDQPKPEIDDEDEPTVWTAKD